MSVGVSRGLVVLDALAEELREVSLAQQVAVELAKPLLVQGALGQDGRLHFGRNIFALGHCFEADDGFSVAPRGLLIVFRVVLKSKNLL